MNTSDIEFMRVAIQVADEGIKRGQTPFGSLIVLDGKSLASSHNTVWQTCDPTAHAEVNAIRGAAATCKSIALTGSTLYSTCEPCPMCMAAIHWAKIARVVFGADIADATGAGFSELTLGARELIALGRSPVLVESGVLAEDCRSLFVRWKQAGLGRSY